MDLIAFGEPDRIRHVLRGKLSQKERTRRKNRSGVRNEFVTHIHRWVYVTSDMYQKCLSKNQTNRNRSTVKRRTLLNPSVHTPVSLLQSLELWEYLLYLLDIDWIRRPIPQIVEQPIKRKDRSRQYNNKPLNPKWHHLQPNIGVSILLLL